MVDTVARSNGSLTQQYLLQRERKVAGDDRDVAETKRGDKRKLVGARSRSYDSIPVYVMDMVRCFHSEP